MKQSSLANALLKSAKDKKLRRTSSLKKTGYAGAVIGRYERNEVKPSIEVTARIAQALGVSLDYLVGN